MRHAVNIILDETVPDGHMVGRDADDNVIVALAYSPVFRYLEGCAADEDFVHTWYVSEGYVRRIEAIHSWAACGWSTVGSA